MKKAITILAVLIVLVSAVFAGAPAAISNQRLTITSTVDRKDPTFKLISGSVVSSDVDTTAGSYDGAAVDSAQDISSQDVVVPFGIKQTTDARNNYQYTFTVTATTFTGDSTAYSTTGTITYGIGTVGTGLSAFVPAAGGNDASGNEGIESVTNQLETSTNNFTYVIKYSGTETVAANSTLVTFPITWGRDRVAETDTYKADVTMTIAIQ